METLKAVLELIYFISAPIIAIIAAFGLWQIKVTRDSARMQATRSALSLSAQQCDHYLRVISPLQDKLHNAIQERGITYLDLAEVTVEPNQVRVKFNKPDDFLEQIQKLTLELLNVLNAMEAFSLFFTTGSADERIAYSSVGSTFCNSARRLLPEIVPHLDSGHFRNLYKLFLTWNSRIESEKLFREKKALDQKLSKVDDKFIQPIGTA